MRKYKTALGCGIFSPKQKPSTSPDMISKIFSHRHEHDNRSSWRNVISGMYCLPFIFAGCLAMADQSPNNTLSILMWEDTLAPQVIEEWETHSESRIEQVFIDSDDKRDAILSSNRARSLDIVVIDSASSKLFYQSGVISPLLASQVPNRKHIDSRWNDQCGPAAVAYFWGTLGLVYRSDLIAEPSSWSDFLQPGQDLQGHLGTLLDSTDTLAPALATLGYPLLSNNKKQLQAAYNLLKAQAPFLLTHEYAFSYAQHGAAAEKLHLALAYSGDHVSMNEAMELEDIWQYHVPKEGTLIWVDCLAIMKNAPNPQLAAEFLDFINQPEIAAMNAEWVEVATPNLAARTLLDEELLDDQSLYPAATTMKNSEVYSELSDGSMRLRNRIRTALQRLYEAQ